MRCIMYRLDISDIVRDALGEECGTVRVDTMDALMLEGSRGPADLICWNADEDQGGSPFFDETFRSSESFCDVVNIVFSTNEVMEIKYREEGCDAYITLPGDKKLIAVRVKMAVERRVSIRGKMMRKMQAELDETQKIMQQTLRDSGMLYFEYYPEEKMAMEFNCTGAFDVEEILYDYPDSWFEKGITHPEDLDILKEAYRRMDAGAEEAECEIRNLRKDNSYLWEKVVFRSVYDESGKRIKVACTGMDITIQKETEAEYRRQLERVAGREGELICRYFADLTSGRCEVISDERNDIPDVDYPRTINEMMSLGDSLIRSSKERDEYHRTFSRENMLEAYEQGNRALEYTYVARLNDNTIQWIETDVYLMRDPGNGDITAQITKYDISHPYMRDLTIRRIADQDYEWIGIINPGKGTTWRLTGKNYIFNTAPPREHDYLKVQQLTIEKVLDKPTEEEKDQYMQDTSIEHIKRELDFHGIYDYYLKEKLDGITTRYKKITYEYADKFNYLIAVKQMDITDIYDREKKGRDELRKALDIAEEASEARNMFLANISHDMRTPLNGIIGFTDLALEREDMPEDGKKYLHEIRESGELLLRLVNDTLDLSRLKSPRMALESTEVDFEKAIDDVANTMRPSMNEKNITFKVERSTRFGMVMTDPFRISQMLLNLLSNAVKFTPEGGHIELIVEKKEPSVKDMNCWIAVRDSGIGMSEDFIPKAFDVFSQEHVMGDDHMGGTGLGLSVVKQIVKLLHGNVVINSKPGEGTEVTIGLPLEKAENAAEQKSTLVQNADRLNGKKVLLCEDHPVNTQLTKLMLSAVGIETTAVADGSLGVSVFSRSVLHEYDAVLMDIRMPVMDGLTAARKIRSLSRPDAQTVPIIAMTANAYDEDMKKSVRAGMDAHVSKPVDRGELYRILLELIER